MRKIVGFSIIILILFILVGCSNDPLIAPSKLFIIGVGTDKHRVLYDNDYSTRVVLLHANETCLLTAVSNRLVGNKDLIWTTNAPEVVKIDELTNKDVRAKALIYGVSKVEVSNGFTTGSCFVIVDDNSHPNGLTISISGVTGLIESSTNEYVLIAHTTSELSNKDMILSYSCSDASKVKKVEWYLDGVLVSYSEDFDISFSSFGEYTVDCVLYGKNNYGVIEPISSSSVNIECKFN